MSHETKTALSQSTSQKPEPSTGSSSPPSKQPPEASTASSSTTPTKPPERHPTHKDTPPAPSPNLLTPQDRTRRFVFERYLTLLAAADNDLAIIADRVRMLAKGFGFGLVDPLDRSFEIFLARQLLISLREAEGKQTAAAILDIPDFQQDERTLLSTTIHFYLPLLLHQSLLVQGVSPWSTGLVPLPVPTTSEDTSKVKSGLDKKTA